MFDLWFCDQIFFCFFCFFFDFFVFFLLFLIFFFVIPKGPPPLFVPWFISGLCICVVDRNSVSTMLSPKGLFFSKLSARVDWYRTWGSRQDQPRVVPEGTFFFKLSSRVDWYRAWGSRQDQPRCRTFGCRPGWTDIKPEPNRPGMYLLFLKNCIGFL